MRAKSFVRQEWWTLGIVVVSVLIMTKTALTAPQPESASVVEVAFEQPRNISDDDGSMKRYLEAVKVVVTGHGFTQKATGPVVWLNGEATLRVIVAENGSSLEAYFYRPLSALEAESAGVWNVQIQDREGADKTSVPGTVEVQRLSSTERAQLNERKKQFGLP